MMTETPTVYVVEDDPAVRDTLVDLLQGAMWKIECYQSAEDFLQACDYSRPGCLLLDVRMPGMSGLDLQAKLLQEKVDLPVIILTGHGDVSMTVRAMKHGAVDFLEKPYRPQQLLASVAQALDLSAERQRKKQHREELLQRVSQLTPSEKEVLQLIVAGRTNEVIAEQLDVSLRTVQYRRADIMKKMDVESKAALLDIVLPIAPLLQS